MSNCCEDCGCRLNNGICSNCHEELYIIENQSDCFDYILSDEFLQKANEQKEEIEQKKRIV